MATTGGSTTAGESSASRVNQGNYHINRGHHHQRIVPGNNVEMASTGGSTTAGESSASRVYQVTYHAVGRVVEVDGAEAYRYYYSYFFVTVVTRRLPAIPFWKIYVFPLMTRINRISAGPTYEYRTSPIFPY